MASRYGKSGIEYLTRVWNPVSGCLHQKQGKCPVRNCWAETITRRFPDNYPDGFNPEIHYDALKPFQCNKPQRIGVCFMGDLFGDWINPHAVDETGRLQRVSLMETLPAAILVTVNINWRSSFFFLTKNAAGYAGWPPFPDNVWIGATAWDYKSASEARYQLTKVTAKHKWLSIEPLLSPLRDKNGFPFDFRGSGIESVVIGQEDHPADRPPKVEWIYTLHNQDGPDGKNTGG